MLVSSVVLSLLGCADGDPVAISPPAATSPTSPTSPTVTDTGTPLPEPTTVWSDPPILSGIRDVAVSSGYVDTWFGLQRGRAAVSLDVDGDGDFDTFVGSPRGTSYVLMNRTDGTGNLRFEAGQVLGQDTVMWGGAANDMDNDGDPDLYVTVGGNEKGGHGFDFLFENVDGTFVDISQQARVWQDGGDGAPFQAYHASAFFWDMDLDGRLDIFTNGSVIPFSLVGNIDASFPLGRNGFLRNRGDGTFEDWAVPLGMTDQWSTRSSTWLDIDNDGDPDEWSLGGSDLSFPQDLSSQAAIPADLNQDGWEDLVVFRRDPKEPLEPLVHSAGHLVWINVRGTGFVEVGDRTGINLDWGLQRDHLNIGVMGCQLGDLNADGIADMFAGNGNPLGGEVNDLMVSVGVGRIDHEAVGPIEIPIYESWSRHIDFPSEIEGVYNDNRYPYRTHGSYFADMDGDGLYELAEHNGGTSNDLGVEEPDRLFKVDWAVAPHWLRLRLTGDGVAMSRDAIGARVRARVIGPSGERWVYATKRSATGFGAQNDPDVFLGLGTVAQVEELWVTWPNGVETQVPVDRVDQVLRVAYAP